MQKDRRPTTQQENTYQMEPKRVFQSFRAKKAAEYIVQSFISHDTEYSQEFANKTAIAISNELLKAIKALKYERYRFVVQTIIGQKRGQGVQVSSRSLNDAQSDTYAEYAFGNSSLYCVVLVHGIYFELQDISDGFE